MNTAYQNLISDIAGLARVFFAEYGRISADDILWTAWEALIKVQIDADLPAFIKLARL